MCGTFFILIWCTCIWPALMQTTSWDLVTSPIVFNEPVELRCTVQGVATCCSGQTRRWIKGSTLIISNGASSSPLKYRETIDANNNQFSLIISSLVEQDLDVYTCSYLNTSPQKTLAQNGTSEWHPNSSESMSTKSDQNSLIDGFSFRRSAVVTKIAPIPSISAKFGERVLAVQSTIQVYNTWFYNITLSLNEDFTCSPKKMLQVTVTAGQYSYNIIEDDVCQCHYCAGWSFLGSFIGIIVAVVISIIWLKCHKGEARPDTMEDSELNMQPGELARAIKEEKEKKYRQRCLCAVIWLIMLINIVCPVLVGYYVCTCLGHSHWLWIICGLGTALIGIGFAYHHKYLKDETLLWGILTVLSIIVIVGIFVLHLLTNRDKKNRPKKDEDHAGKKEHGKSASSTAGEIHKN